MSPFRVSVSCFSVFKMENVTALSLQTGSEEQLRNLRKSEQCPAQRQRSVSLSYVITGVRVAPGRFPEFIYPAPVSM